MSNISKNVKTKMVAYVMVGALAAAVLGAAVAFSPIVAFAQESAVRNNGLDGQQRSIDSSTASEQRTEHRPGLHFTKGAGIATDSSTGDNFRSGFVVLTQKWNSTEVNEHAVKRGMIVISVNGERIGYKMLPETWKIVVAADGLTLRATGQVKNADEKTFNVDLKGYFAFHSRLGNLWSIDGTMKSEDNTSYQLHYVAISHGLRPNTATDATDESQAVQ